MNKFYDVIVIGGGPAGMIAAGTAIKRGKSVLLIEKNDILGKKLLITGKGRCNITNNADISDFFENIPKNSSFLYSAFYKFSNRDLISLFDGLSLPTKVERGERVFPVSDKSNDVLLALKKYIEGVDVVFKSEVSNINVYNNCVCSISLKNGTNYECNRAILATGGASYKITGSTGDGYRISKNLGHLITPLKPSLVPLNSKESWIQFLQGLALKNVAVTLFSKEKLVYSDFGEMLFTHYGVSGPVILSLSSHLDDIDNSYILIDLKPALTNDQLDNRLQKDFLKFSRKAFSNSLDDILPKLLIPVIISLSGIPPDIKVNQISKEQRMKLVELFKGLHISISSKRPIDEAIITSGGISINEVSPQNMESKIINNLFFAGEILDVDGYTGGFNLQIAFSTGYLAGISV